MARFRFYFQHYFSWFFIGLGFAISLLNYFLPPSLFLWKVSIATSELGYVLALIPLVCLLISLSQKAKWRAALSLASIFLLLLPSLQLLTARERLLKEIKTQMPELEISSLNFDWLKALSGFKRKTETPIHLESFRYSETPVPLLMDLYRQENFSEKLPLILTIHGGSWSAGDRLQIAHENKFLASLGYVVAAIDYRLAPDWKWPAQLEDIETALKFLKANAQKFALDTSRIVLMGRSAGGQLASIAGFRLKDPGIKAVVSFYGPEDLVWGWNRQLPSDLLDTHKIFTAYLGGSPLDLPKVYEEASPVENLHKNLPAVLLIHGEKDPLVSFRHSEKLAAKLKEQHQAYLFLRLPFATHGFEYHLNGPSAQIAFQVMQAFLKHQLN